MRALLMSPWRVLLQERTLYLPLLQREIATRYRATALGWLWPVLHPLALLAIYAFVFGTVFGARWGQSVPEGNRWHFALMLFAGLICFNLIADCLGRAPLLVINQANYVKRVVFPLEVLSIVQVGAGLFNFTISLLVLGFFMLLASDGHVVHLLTLWLVLLPYALFLLGLSWLLAALGVYFRDLEQVMPTVVTALMFLSPVFYAVEVLPVAFRHVLLLNPLTHVIEMVRQLLFVGQFPSPRALLLLYAMGLGMCYAGLAFFRRAARGFADVL